jgi:hypothetical protein
MCQEEFKNLFCKGMFKKALIGIIDKLQKQVDDRGKSSMKDTQTSFMGDQ